MTRRTLEYCAVFVQADGIPATRELHFKRWVMRNRFAVPEIFMLVPPTVLAAVAADSPDLFLVLYNFDKLVYLRADNNQELIMAKGNRSQKKEIKKPKKEKPKAAPATSRRIS